MGNPDLPYALVYKLSCLLCGIVLVYLGYLLFVKGFFKSAGDATAEYNGAKFVITKGAPGTFFSILGAFVLCFTIIKGMKSDVQNTALNIVNEKLDSVLNRKDRIVKYSTLMTHIDSNSSSQTDSAVDKNTQKLPKN